jgi:hypothetical protein
MEGFRKKSVRLLAIIELIVVSAGVDVLVPLHGVFSAIQLEERNGLLIDVRFNEGREKTTIVLSIVNQ